MVMAQKRGHVVLVLPPFLLSLGIQDVSVVRDPLEEQDDKVGV